MKLIRIESGKNHTLGVITLDNRFICYTLELEWRDNLANVSCIPAGTYEIARNISPKFGETIEVKNVPNRSNILMHAGNSFKDTKGCILVGNNISFNSGIRFIENSLVTLKKLIVEHDGVLEIIQTW